MTGGMRSASPSILTPSASSAPAAKPNYRQVGTRASGAVVRGAVGQRPISDLKSKVASIPSKYETVLLQREAQERNGFGNRTHRFGESENELPGPGNYYSPTSFVRTATDSGSVSRLGYSTGFVSKTKRFNDRVKEVLPGPGAYQPTRVDKRAQNRKHGLSSFVNTPKNSCFNNQQAAAVPGPADYNAAQASAAFAHNIARAAFTSKTSRGFEPRKDVPAPGQYDNPIQLGQSLREHATAPHSVFKSTAIRLGSNATLAPGPGAYNAEDAESALRYDWISRAHASAAFQTGTVDRFGRIPGKTGIDTEPGPGSYEVRSLVDTAATAQAAVTVFKSKTSRGDAFGGGGSGSGQVSAHVPGPAFYNPSSPGRRSHLLNANKKWL